MNCVWHAFINLIPPRLRDEVDRLGNNDLQELRMRLGRPPEMIKGTQRIWLNGKIKHEDLEFTTNIASQYSAWAAESTQSGYITAPGGHRLGVCGEVAVSNGKISSVSRLTSVCLRVARDFSGIGNGLAKHKGSILIIGKPGVGKTTLLRDLIRCISLERQTNIAVVDERMEIFPMHRGMFSFDPGDRTDVLSGCPKALGVEMVLRTMTPQMIAVDEISAEADALSIHRAAWCGVDLLATAHATCIEDLRARPVYKALLKEKLFQHVVIMRADKSWTYERIC